ncbi:Fe-S-cluster oxidoreductase [Streptococcus pyogenes]|nr:Fe-S-cluster oxidoreductase [Streptococcus pyogenes]VHF44698.1 Fe-S-cluster oxidoreductase [Streptococcus pyogenes]VHG74676.1 Fe-S-cluster oxidoreductase [Streptococcus pyogenes]VHM87394.1 Fe-S-cluster oxidoreductase [Streptococcus pyogenes]
MPPKTIDIEKYHQLALQRQAEHRKFLATLKKKPPKHLDKIGQDIHQEVFQEIDCTSSANCCKDLGPDLTETDIVKIAKLFRMKLATFEKTYLRVDEDDDKVFRFMPCPFLGGDNL